ncbi:MAG TPA: hypothetical protein VMR28_02540, partial [Candidatus Saccharimonadales bacterium]|nr:hypothetical protein [Candidatus Saccharimonadales bacterium]
MHELSLPQSRLSSPELQGVGIEHYLTEVDHLDRLRRPDGSHDLATLIGVRQNLVPAIKEAAIPHAVSTTHQEYRDGDFWWLDQTGVDVARSGYRFHRYPMAVARVQVEIAEADDVNKNLRPGIIKVFLSPKMTRKDAPYSVAKQEHLADDDMLRIHMLDIDEYGNTRGKYMQSLMVRGIPLDAWVRMLSDPGNIFGKAFNIEDEASALSVMKLHQELELPETALPEGVISLVEAVLPYADSETQIVLQEQLALFRCNQAELHRQAENIADRWLAFEVELAD